MFLTQRRVSFSQAGCYMLAASRGVTWGDCGGAESLRRAPKTPNNVTSTFFNTVHLLVNDLSFQHLGATLTSCPGCYLTLLHPWLHLTVVLLTTAQNWCVLIPSKKDLIPQSVEMCRTPHETQGTAFWHISKGHVFHVVSIVWKCFSKSLFEIHRLTPARNH